MIPPEVREALNREGCNNLQLFWIILCQRKKCLYCKTRFDVGLVNKHPGETNFILDSRFWFTGEYLAHLYQTHGFSPDDMTLFLEELDDNLPFKNENPAL